MSANLTAQTIDQLLDRFLAIALAQDLAERKSKYAQYSRLYRRMEEVTIELKRRPGDARRDLSRFFGHPNPQVRLKAAISCLAIFPDEARRVLQDLFDGNWFPQAAEAKGILMSMDAGRYVPD